MKYLPWIGLLLGMLALSSIFTYTFFDISWWVPLAYGDVARGVELVCLHVLGMICGFGCAFELYDRS